MHWYIVQEIHFLGVRNQATCYKAKHDDLKVNGQSLYKNCYFQVIVEFS